MRSVFINILLFSLFSNQMHATENMSLLTGPVAQDDDNFTYQDFSVTGTLADNDYDPDGDQLTYSLVTGTPDGTITINPDGSYLYVPNPVAYGVEYITYQVCDDDGNCATATLTMFVIFLNDDPIAIEDFIVVEMNTPYNGNAGANDIEPDNEIRHYYQVNRPLITAPANGSVSFNTDGTFTYTPNNGYLGSDYFEYAICDPCLRCDTNTVNITVVNANEGPVANDSPLWSLSEDANYMGTLSSLVSDPEMDPISYSISAEPDHGTVSLQPDGSFTYTPSPNYFGDDLFEYQACDIVNQCDFGIVYLQINPQNDPPQLTGESLNVSEDSSINGNLAANDTDDETPQLTYSILVNALHGSWNLSTNGTFEYIPQPDYFGNDVMTYQACDAGGLCQTATLNIQVVSVNDSPDVSNSSFSGPEDNDLVALAGPATDIENNPLTFSLITPPLHGSIFLESDGSILYSPNQNWHGIENLTYQVCDNLGACTSASLTIQITSVNDAPIAVDDLNDFAFEGQTINGILLNNDTDVDNDLLTYSTSDVAQNGVFVLDEYGTYSYTPNPLWHGTETFTIQVCDPSNACDESVLTFEIVSVNDGIQAQNGSASVNEDGTLSSSIASLATDLDNDPIDFAVAIQPQFGSLSLDSNGNFVYTPQSNFSGTDQFTYSACDPMDACDDGIFTITILPINDAPVAFEDELSGEEDLMTVGNVAINDQDIDSGTLTYSIISQPMYGAAIMTSNGVLQYQPESNYYGIDFLTYEVCDGLACDATTVTFLISQVNDTPEAGGDSFIVMSEALLSGDVSGNDSDIESSQLFYTIQDDVSHGTLIMSTNGSFTYQSFPGYQGLDQAIISVCDEENDCVTSVLEIGVLANQSAPDAVSDTYSIPEEGVLNANVGDNDSDVDGGILTYTLVGEVDHGILTFNSDGSFELITYQNYNGPVTFTYQVCDETDLCSLASCVVNVTPVNDPPLAVDDYAFFISNGVLTGNVGSNDSDVDSGNLTYTLLTPPQYGDMEFQSDGSYVFTSMSIFDGIVVALYEVCDGINCSTASFVIEISFLNTIPVVLEDNASTSEDTPVVANVGANDVEPNGEILFFYLTGLPDHGSASIGLTTGLVTYTPDPGFSGLDTMLYYACDPCGDCVSARIIIETLPVNDAPVTALAEFYTYDDMTLNEDVNPYVSDPDGIGLTYSLLSAPVSGDLTFNSDGTFTYVTDPDFLGVVSFTYEVCDNELCSTGNVDIYVIFSNDSPIAGDDNFEMNEDNELVGDIGLNDFDSDPIATAPVFSIISNPQYGEFILNPDGTFIYLPGNEFFGTDVLQYTICDDMNTCDSATVTIQVYPVNDLPVIENEYIILPDNNLTNGDVSLNDSDAEGFDLTYSVLTEPLHGTLIMNPDGSYTFTPTGDFTGEDFIEYLACDDENCVQGSLTFLLIGNNNPPVVLGETFNVLEDDEITESVATNDSDPDGDNLTYTVLEGPFHGSIEMNADGSFTYTPELNFYGVDFLIYTVCDPFTACAEATLQLTVDFVNDIPIAEDDFVTTTENTLVEGTVAANDIEYDDEILFFDVLEDQSNGLFEMNPDGSYSYLPNDGAIGTFYVYYEACDPCGACNDGLLTITVEPQIITNTSPSTQSANIQLCVASSASLDLDDYVSDLEDLNENLSFNFTSPALGEFEFNPNTHVLNYSSDQINSTDIEITYTVCDAGDPQMCTSGVISIDVVPINEIFISNVFVENVLCFGDANGSIEILEISGEGPFTVEWENGFTGLSLFDIPVGDYEVTISSNAMCSSPVTSILTVSGPFAPVTAQVINAGNITDDQSGSIDITVTGGTSPYFVEWFGPGNYNIESEDATNITQAGMYTALISDLNGCDAEVEVNITPVVELVSEFDVIVYPNPSAGQFKVALNGTNGRAVVLRVFDTSGKLILEQYHGSYPSGKVAILDLSNFSQGIYELQIATDDISKSMRLLKNE